MVSDGPDPPFDSVVSSDQLLRETGSELMKSFQDRVRWSAPLVSRFSGFSQQLIGSRDGVSEVDRGQLEMIVE